MRIIIGERPWGRAEREGVVLRIYIFFPTKATTSTTHMVSHQSSKYLSEVFYATFECSISGDRSLKKTTENGNRNALA